MPYSLMSGSRTGVEGEKANGLGITNELLHMEYRDVCFPSVSLNTSGVARAVVVSVVSALLDNIRNYNLLHVGRIICSREFCRYLILP
jgi:hypothetical protein